MRLFPKGNVTILKRGVGGVLVSLSTAESLYVKLPLSSMSLQPMRRLLWYLPVAHGGMARLN